jgi:NAD(P)-dependent dehydrogenase (short-subunit alcohol dehydrogenase family)
MPLIALIKPTILSRQSGLERHLPMTKTFLITGVSSGFGRALAEAALSDGHAVAGTVRNDADKQKFEALGRGAHALVLDVTNTKAIAPAVADVENGIARSTFW